MRTGSVAVFRLKDLSYSSTTADFVIDFDAGDALSQELIRDTVSAGLLFCLAQSRLNLGAGSPNLAWAAALPETLHADDSAADFLSPTD